MEKITGNVYVLGSHIDTDQIIPAQHLVYSLSDQQESQKYGQLALSGVPKHRAGLPEGNIPFVAENKKNSDYTIIVAGANFGCGSSREHAPFALQKAGIKAVIAPTYARIFYRNAVDGGFLLPLESQLDLTGQIDTGNILKIDLTSYTVNDLTTKSQYKLKALGSILPIVKAGGLFEYARKNNLV